MRYNGVSINAVHPLVSLSTAHLDGWRRDVRKVEAQAGDLTGYARDEAAVYVAVVNIAGRTVEQGEEALRAVRAWAYGGGGVHEITPHGAEGYAYDGILQAVDDAEISHGFGTVRVSWLLERPQLRTAAESSATASAVEMAFTVGGTYETFAVFEAEPLTTQETLTLTIDGLPLFARTAKTTAGNTLVVDTIHEAARIGGTDVRSQTDWTLTDYDRPLAPGEHVLRASAQCRLTVRWHERWA